MFVDIHQAYTGDVPEPLAGLGAIRGAWVGFQTTAHDESIERRSNSSRFPTVPPWDGTALRWFGELAADGGMWQALVNSAIVAAGVLCLAVPIGIATALFLNPVSSHAKPFLYALILSPLLCPGGNHRYFDADLLARTGRQWRAVSERAGAIHVHCRLRQRAMPGV